MRPYLATFGVSTPLKVPEEGMRMVLADGAIDVTAVRVTQSSPNGPLHLGIEYRVRLEADSAEAALTIAEPAVEYFNNLLCAVTSASVPLVTPLMAIDLDRSTNARELFQRIVGIPTTIPRSRVVDDEVLRQFGEAWNRFVTEPADRDTIMRALWHYRKAIGLVDLVEEFTELWMGLECLNRLIVKRHGLATTFVARHCDNCGAPMRVAGSSAGITYALTTLAKCSTDQAKRIREIRKQFQHGLSGAHKSVAELPALVPLMRTGIIQGAGEILSLPVELMQRLDRMKYPVHASPGEITVKTTLHHLPVDELLTATTVPTVVVQSYFDPAPQFPEHKFPGVNFRLGIVNYSGSWGPITFTAIGHDDPEQPPELVTFSVPSEDGT